MKHFFSKITGGNQRLLVAPTVWAFIENTATMAPSLFVMLAMAELIRPLQTDTAIDAGRMWMYAAGLAGALILQSVISILTYRYSYYNSHKAVANMRLSMIERMRRVPLGYFAARESGQIIHTFVSDPDEMEKATSYFLPQIISMGAMSLLSFVMLMCYDWRLALPMYAMLPLSIVCMWLAMRLRFRQADRVSKARMHATTMLNEYLLGMRNLKSYNQTGAGFSRLDGAFASLRSETTKEEGVPGALTLLAAHMINFGAPLIIFAGSMLLLTGSVDITLLLAFLILSTRLYTPLTAAITCAILTRTAVGAANRVEALRQAPVSMGEAPLPGMGDICFENVRFSYLDKEVLRDINLRIPKGKLTALVGPSGSGKSTILRLIARFWDANSGDIRIGDQPLTAVRPEELYAQISMVFQENYLFGDTIRSNILFGRGDKTEAEMIEAARQACCHDFIMRLPQGYDTVIGEGGATLSGGERQRIAIARAILKDAPIVLLDEPTSSLDAENEIQIQRAIDALTKNRTVVMIAHRLQTIAAADQIVVIDQGIVAQRGTHEELLRDTNGLYHRLWHTQHRTQGWSIQNEKREGN